MKKKNKEKEIEYNGKCFYCNHIHTDITIMNCTLCFTSLKPRIFDYIIRNDLNQYDLDFNININGFFDYKMDIRKCLRIFNKLNNQNNDNEIYNEYTSLLIQVIVLLTSSLILLFIGIGFNLLPHI